MKTKKYWELVKRYREYPESVEVHSEVSGIYCSRFGAMNEKESYLETHERDLEDGTLVSLKVRKMKDTIEEVELISMEEMQELFERDLAYKFGEVYG